jgi:hypothetical protein
MPIVMLRDTSLELFELTFEKFDGQKYRPHHWPKMSLGMSIFMPYSGITVASNQIYSRSTLILVLGDTSRTFLKSARQYLIDLFVTSEVLHHTPEFLAP